jgi:hypothetical protein
MVSAAFAEVLAARRHQFNAWAAEARRRYPGFDHDAFSCFLIESADPVVVAVAEAALECVPKVASAAFRMGLDLAGQRLVDASPRTRALANTWATVMPRFAPLVARRPEQALGMLSNAVLHLSALPGVSTQRWCRDMAALAPGVSCIAQLRALGQVLAWRAGAAHYRQGAITAADHLPETLALAAFGAVGAVSWAQLRGQLIRDPWWHAPDDPDGTPMRTVGTFAGLGGMFIAPPTVRVAGSVSHSFVIRSGDRDFLLYADAFGAVLLPAGPAEFDGARSPSAPAHVVRDQELVVGRQRIMLNMPVEELVVCATDATIAVTSPYTHVILLVARQ